MSINKVILIGRLGQDPDVRYAPSGSAVANFSIATSESWMDKSGQKQEKTEWHRIVVWGKMAELCKQYLSKGRQVYIEGRLQTRQWQDKENQTRSTTEIMAQSVQFLGAASGAGAQSQTGSERSYGGESSFGGAPSGGYSGNSGYAGGSSSGSGAYSGGAGSYAAGASSSHPTGLAMDAPSFTEDDIPF